MTVTLVWSDANGNPLNPSQNPKPPNPACFKVVSSAIYQVKGKLTASADDGFGDTVVEQNLGYYNPYTFIGGQSTGTHLVQRDGSSGTIVLEFNQSVDAHAAGGPAFADTSLWVYPDSRHAEVSSTLDPTCYRAIVNGVPTAVANTRQSDGTMNGDTVVPTQTTSVSYLANYVGPWGFDSYFHWFSNLTGSYNSGGFIPNQVPALTVQYTNPPAAPGATDHIHLRLIDSVDSANATANYWMRFHDKYEDWTELTRDQHPHAFVSGGQNPDWVFLTTTQNNTSIEQQRTVEMSYQTQLTESGTIGNTLVTQLTDPAGFIQFQHNESITSTTAVTVTLSDSVPIKVAPYTYVDVYVGVIHADLTGTCSGWGANGYQGELIWTGVDVPNSGGVQIPGVAYDENDL